MAVAVTAIGVLGTLVGSFLNVVVHRLPRGESVVHPRSRCPACGTQLAERDNVPVISWLVLRGRCRSCGVAISPRYPLVELATGLAFAAVVVIAGFDIDLVWQLPLVAALLAAAAIDLEHRIIPNKIVAPLVVWGALTAFALRLDELPGLAIAGGGAFAFLLVTALVNPAGMGMGDVKLAGAMGLYLGASIVPAMFVAFLAGSLIGVGIIAVKGGAGRKTGVPFGPFLALGGIVGLLAGAELIDAYRSLFLS
ncbi:MAG: prepilin peptidase [Thermoleophilaceae bacterium]